MMGLQARGTGGVDSASTGGTWDISNADRIGKGEVQLCNILIEGAAQLVKWENMMEGDDKAKAEQEMDAQAGVDAASAGDPNYPPLGISPGIQKLEKWIQVGCGDKPYYCEEKNATFPSDKTPDKLPDISKHNNCMTDFFNKNPDVYDKLKDRVTKAGVNLAHCIKTGMDNPGHPHIKTVGLTAGEESYEVFKELFDPVISDRHNGYGVNDKQPTDMDINKISDIDIDPFNKYVLTTRVRTGRSVRGFKL